MIVHKVELLIFDNEDIGSINLKEMLENTNYPNDCITSKVMSLDSRDITNWGDDHPLNKKDTIREEYKRIFANPFKEVERR